MCWHNQRVTNYLGKELDHLDTWRPVQPVFVDGIDGIGEKRFLRLPAFRKLSYQNRPFLVNPLSFFFVQPQLPQYDLFTDFTTGLSNNFFSRRLCQSRFTHEFSMLRVCCLLPVFISSANSMKYQRNRFVGFLTFGNQTWQWDISYKWRFLAHIYIII